MEHANPLSQCPELSWPAPSPSRAANPPPIPPPPRRSSGKHSDVPRAPPQLSDPVAGSRLASRSGTPDISEDQILPGIPRSHSPYYTTSHIPQACFNARSQSSHSSQSLRSSNPPAAEMFAAKSSESSRPRTRTLDVLSSPSEPISPPRRRVGSMTQAREVPPKPVEVVSYKHDRPTTRRPSSAESQRLMDYSGARQSRQPSPNPSVISSRISSDPSGLDPRTMLHLMQKSRGRMKGLLRFRHTYRTTWSILSCFIDLEDGSLMGESEAGGEKHFVLIPDLRGCNVTASYDRAVGKPTLRVITEDEALSIHLSPVNGEYFHAWFAALLCWQPVPPGASIDHIVTQEPTPISFSSHGKTAILSGTLKDKARVIKTGQAWLIEPEEPLPKSRQSVKSAHSRSGPIHSPSSKTSVSCALFEDGDFRLTSDEGNALIAKVSLSHLSRSAVQRVHHSVWDMDRCLGIFPHYLSSADACSRIQPLYLSFEENVVYEAWVVLLKCFAIPQLYGPANTSGEDIETATEVLPGLPRCEMPGLIRLERSMHLKISEVKLRKPRGYSSARISGQSHASASGDRRKTSSYYAEVVIDGQRRARTSVKRTASDPYWYETLDLPDLAAATPVLSVRLITFDEHSHTRHADEHPEDGSSVFDGEHHQVHFRTSEELVGETLVALSDVDQSKDIERWWPLKGGTGEDVGEVLFKVRFEEDAILMDREYEGLYELLHNFNNVLTIQIGAKIPNELSALASCLLNIFQTTDQAENWLRNLCEEEIDGVLKDHPNRLASRFLNRLDSNESRDSLNDVLRDAGDDRHNLVRDIGRNATAEANLLFRGNTLASKSMDAHMKRLGRAYLEATVAPKLREIARLDLDCEVNPNKVTDKRTLQRHWDRLLHVAEDLWGGIRDSAERCPSELRVIFRHIRECANDRYGYFMRTVTYSSVSGFLFLRFFCAATLSPQAFDIIRHEPSTRAIRTFTLLAKGLQGLANMTPFGNKEPWMEPMNKFLNAHKNEFKSFIDNICNVPSEMPLHEPSLSYSTPLQIYRRLPSRSKEGFLSLPYHIDRPRNSAMLVKLWLDHAQNVARADGPSLTGDLARFHDLCLRLRQRTQGCYNRIERLERRGSSFVQKWIHIAERMERFPAEFWIKQRAITPNATNSMVLPLSQPPPPPRHAARDVPTHSRPLALRSSSEWSIRRRAQAYSEASEDEPNGGSAGDCSNGVGTPNVDDSVESSSDIDTTSSNRQKEKKKLRLPFGKDGFARKRDSKEKGEEMVRKHGAKEAEKDGRRGEKREREMSTSTLR